jgi:dolichol-phosphate mannosyltransferase
VPITWHNRRVGETKLKIKEMGSRYLFICLYVWLEKYFSRGDYKRALEPSPRPRQAFLAEEGRARHGIPWEEP